jgi:ATP diphosphatase
VSRASEQLERLIQIMARLRAPDGCPWDREQELRTLRPYLIEEAFEVLDAMDAIVEKGEHHPGVMRELPIELGDLLFQIVFHAQLARERGEFEMADVIQAISDKIESRHPHVFGDLTGVTSADQVLQSWAGFKERERRAKGETNPSAIDGVPRDAPALLRAERLTEKASRVGFDWPDVQGARKKLDEELGELDAALATGKRDEIEDELGDVLFSLCNLARFTKTPAEDALRKTIRKFERRFRHVEAALRDQDKKPQQVSLAEMDALWDQAKALERAQR